MAETAEQTELGGAAPAPSPAKAEGKKTAYVILASVDEGMTWKVEGLQEATSKANALSHFYEMTEIPGGASSNGADPPEPLFQAVPQSSWKALKPATPRPRIPFSEVAE